MSFYVNLPSNGADLTSEYGIKNNTQTDFSIELANPLEFKTDYEVALVECTYRKNWTVTAGIFTIYKSEFIIGIIQPKINMIKTTYLIVDENIETNKMINQLNNIINMKEIKFTLNEKNDMIVHVDKGYILEIKGYFSSFLNNVKVSLREENKKINNINIHTAYRFGNSPNIYLFGDDNVGVKVPIRSKIIKFIDEIFVYTDIIENIHVGKTMVKLLKVLSDNSNYDDVVSHNINPPHYMPLNFKNISQIRMYMVDSLGNPIKFMNTSSRVYYKLHFRPIQQL